MIKYNQFETKCDQVMQSTEHDHLLSTFAVQSLLIIAS